MEKELLKINILSIAVAGMLMLLTGLVLYLFKATVSNHVRFFLPIPPLGVAAYVFVFNLYKHYNGVLPEKRDTLLEVLCSTATASIVFGVFTTLLIASINYLKRHL